MLRDGVQVAIASSLEFDATPLPANRELTANLNLDAASERESSSSGLQLGSCTVGSESSITLDEVRTSSAGSLLENSSSRI